MNVHFIPIKKTKMIILENGIWNWIIKMESSITFFQKRIN